MKNLIFSTLLLLAVNNSHEGKNISAVYAPEFIYETIYSPATTQNDPNPIAPAVPLTISKFVKYLDDNKDFQDVLISFGVNNRNQLYFIALAANKPALGSSLKPSDRSDKEFSSEKSNGSLNVTGSNREDQSNFVKGIGNSLTIKAYYMNMNDLLNKMREYSNANTRNIEVDIVSTTIDNQTFMDLVFPPIDATGNNRMLSTFRVGESRSAPSSGCPPFNCNY